jgi:hypothetical protein
MGDDKPCYGRLGALGGCPAEVIGVQLEIAAFGLSGGQILLQAAMVFVPGFGDAADIELSFTTPPKTQKPRLAGRSSVRRDLDKVVYGLTPNRSWV